MNHLVAGGELGTSIVDWGRVCARLAQSVERETLNLAVVGSSPTLGGGFLAAFFLMARSSASPMDWSWQSKSSTLADSAFQSTADDTAGLQSRIPSGGATNSMSDCSSGLSQFSLYTFLRSYLIFFSYIRSFWANIINWGTSISISPYLVPYLAMAYLQLLFHICWLMVVIRLVWTTWMGIQHDVDIKIRRECQFIVQQIEECTKHYFENNCHFSAGNSAPALDSLCRKWKVCMEQDPTMSVSRAKVTAETLAEILNGFVEKVSYKSMLFIIIGAATLFFLSNALLNFTKSKSRKKEKGTEDSGRYALPCPQSARHLDSKAMLLEVE